ncbi:hypothetical protein QA641_11375 [Bradyrhizobium sp. CB1650]|uniref:hypothetical protein n=1 Tax=Bradyrhizobium sp. CB1650 TaxID=3039153 RepID=UPI002434D3D1|nr:hypothetical protein [Bradyrhizobium sp. CB1650]WGD54450.1 hypothetical protein QA641_11375 [Bradyrhizobium sp. CB1650]
MEIRSAARRIKFATLARDLARAVLQTESDASIKCASSIEPGRDLHDFVAFADRTPALDDVLARCVFGRLEAISASFDWAKVSTKRPDRSASQILTFQVKAKLE